VDDADAAFLRDGDGQPGFGDRVHGGRHQRQVQADVAGELGGEGGVLGQDLGERWHQQHVVEGERFAEKAHRDGSKRRIVRPPSTAACAWRASTQGRARDHGRRGALHRRSACSPSSQRLQEVQAELSNPACRPRRRWRTARCRARPAAEALAPRHLRIDQQRPAQLDPVAVAQHLVPSRCPPQMPTSARASPGRKGAQPLACTASRSRPASSSTCSNTSRAAGEQPA
jgi:hypothetical protein